MNTYRNVLLISTCAFALWAIPTASLAQSFEDRWSIIPKANAEPSQSAPQSAPAVEDTRHTQILLRKHDIRAKHLTAYTEFNHKRQVAVLVGQLDRGWDVALVSDAGTPALSDPGEQLVRAAIAAGHDVVAVPGPARPSRHSSPRDCPRASSPSSASSRRRAGRVDVSSSG